MLIYDTATCPYKRVMDNSRLYKLLHPEKIQANLKIRYMLGPDICIKGRVDTPLPYRKVLMSTIIIRGQGLMHINEQTENVGAEQAVFFPAGSVQYISTMREEDLEFLAIVDSMRDATYENYIH